VDLVDETFIVSSRRPLADVVADPRRWAHWWPDLRLAVFMDRGLDGMRWSMSGSMVGSCEIWLEEVLDGVLLHYYLRGDLHAAGRGTTRVSEDSPRSWRLATRERRRRALAWKAHAWALKDELEAGRRPGLSAALPAGSLLPGSPVPGRTPR
jgi:hypothetical protein